jgi:phospholipase/carboxylesterase
MVGEKDTSQVPRKMTDLPSLIRAPLAGGPPRRLVVLLHGLGAEGADLIDLAPVLARSMPDAMFLAPDAPLPCDMAPFGRQWFSLQSRAPKDVARGIAAAAPVLQDFLAARLEDHGLPASALALLGFSQGAMMALHVGLRMDPPPAAVVGFSGRLVELNETERLHPKPPVLLVHGEADDVVPFAAMAAAEKALVRRSVTVTCHARPGLGHAIDPEGLDLAAAFLARHLSRPSP